jgi:hypothetical protein
MNLTWFEKHVIAAAVVAAAFVLVWISAGAG